MDNPPPKMDAMQPDMRAAMFSPKPAPQRPTGDLAEQMMSSIRRLRILEERSSILHRKTQVLEQNVLAWNKKSEADIKKIDQQLVEVKADVADIKNTIKMIVGEVQEAAKRQDVEMLKKYITLWEPLNFVTRNEVRKLIEEILNDIEEARQPPQ